MSKKLFIMFILMMFLGLLITCIGNKTVEGTPSAPKDFIVVEVTESSISVSWKMPDSEGDFEIIRYEVQKNGDKTWIETDIVFEYKFTGLKCNTNYTFKVRAVNSQGTGTITSIRKKTEKIKSSSNFEYGNSFVKAKIGNNYKITYKYTYTEEGDEYGFFEKTMIYTPIGLYTALNFSNDSYIYYLYVKNNSGTYDYYYGNPIDGFVLSETAEQLTEEERELETFLEMTYYNTSKSKLKKNGADMILGRNCEKYTYTIAAYGVTVTKTYWIDKATGVCLKYTWTDSIKGQSETANFECTEFKIGGVELPGFASTQTTNGWTPNNIATQLLPEKPYNFQISYAKMSEGNYYCSLNFTSVTLVEVKTFIEQVKLKGFNIDIKIFESGEEENILYSFKAYNIDRYCFELSYGSYSFYIEVETTN